MQTTTLMLDFKPEEISALMELCRSRNRTDLLKTCSSEHQVAALNAALDEIMWQLASSGNEVAVEILAE